MALLCDWHQISGISREVEFSGCPGTRQCPGPKEMGIKVKVERMLVLFCSCAVQREVFLPGAERGEGTLARGMLLPVLNKNYRNSLSEGQEGCFLLLSMLANDGGVLLLSMLANDGGVLLLSMLVNWLMEWLDGWKLNARTSSMRGSDGAPCLAGLVCGVLMWLWGSREMWVRQWWGGRAGRETSKPQVTCNKK